MARISDCCEKEYCWYFIYIVHGNGVEGDHKLLKRRRLIRGFDLQEAERVVVARIGY